MESQEIYTNLTAITIPNQLPFLPSSESDLCCPDKQHL